MRGSLLVLEANCLTEAAAQFVLQPQYTDNPQNICNEMHFKVAVRKPQNLQGFSVHCGCKQLPLEFPYSKALQWRIKRGFNGFHGEPLLKGCLRKYYAQTYYVHYSHTRATHFSFTVPIMHMCQLNNFLYQKFDACMTYVHVYTTRNAWQP